MLDLPRGSQPCQSGSNCYKGCVRASHEDWQGHATTDPYHWWESGNPMHNEIPLVPELWAIRLSQACNWYLSEEKGGPCQLQSSREMERGRRACLKLQIVVECACEVLHNKPVEMCLAICFVINVLLFLLFSLLWNVIAALLNLWQHSYKICIMSRTAINCTVNNTSDKSTFEAVFSPNVSKLLLQLRWIPETWKQYCKKGTCYVFDRDNTNAEGSASGRRMKSGS